MVLDRALGRGAFTHHATDEEARKSGAKEVLINGQPASKGSRLEGWAEGGWGMEKQPNQIKILAHLHSNSISEWYWMFGDLGDSNLIENLNWNIFDRDIW